MNWLLVAILGLVLGSFFNVCIWRIPRGESIGYPPSHCPRCNKPIRFYDNIPVLSYIILRGRCRDCGKPISIRYPLIESLTALLFVLAYARFGLHWALLRGIVFIGFLIVLAGIDLEHKIIPFGLSVAGVVIGLVFSLFSVFRFSFVSALWGGVLGAGFILFAWGLWRFILARPFRRLGVKRKEGMGWGDVYFAGMLGVFTGPKGMSVGLGCAVVFGVIVGILLRILGKTRAGQEVPFGPFLALGGLVGLFWGEEIFGWYIRTVLPRILFVG